MILVHRTCWDTDKTSLPDKLVVRISPCYRRGDGCISPSYKSYNQDPRYTRPRSIHGVLLESATIVSIVRHVRRNGSPRNLPESAGLGEISQIPCLGLAVFGVR